MPTIFKEEEKESERRISQYRIKSFREKKKKERKIRRAFMYVRCHKIERVKLIAWKGTLSILNINSKDFFFRSKNILTYLEAYMSYLRTWQSFYYDI